MISMDTMQAPRVDAIVGARESGKRSAILSMATGTGKTTVAAKFIKRGIEEWNGRFLYIADQDELIEQPAARFERFGIPCVTEKAEQDGRKMLDVFPDCRVVIACRQTLHDRRLKRWDRDFFTDVIFDEAHKSASERCRAIFDHFDSARFRLGMTATPFRMDGKELVPKLYECVAAEYGLGEAISNGHLVPIEAVRIEHQIDIRGIRTTGGDLNQGDLEQIIKPKIEFLANAIKKEWEKLGIRKGIVFTPDIGSAMAMAAALKDLGIAAEGVSGKSADRKDILRRFEAGETRCLCNCALLTTGFDSPAIEAVIILRPTKSWTLYVQMVGRGTRTAPGKSKLYLIDFAWVTDKHDLIQPPDLFTKGADEKIKQRARKLLEAGEKDPKRAAELAELEEFRREQRRLKVPVAERPVDYRRVAFDPVGVQRLCGIQVHEDVGRREAPTLDQLRQLERLGLKGVDTASRAMAEAIIDHWTGYHQAGMITSKQFNVIRKVVDPVTAAKLTNKEASRIIFGMTQRRPPAELADMARRFARSDL